MDVVSKASYSSWRHLQTAGLKCRKAHLHRCRIVQQNIGSWWRPVCVLTGPNKCSSQSCFLYGLQQHKTLLIKTTGIIFPLLSFSALLPNVLALFKSPDPNLILMEDDDDVMNDDLFNNTRIKVKPGSLSFSLRGDPNTGHVRILNSWK